MVLQIGTDARAVHFHLDTHVLQMLRRTDAGEHQQFRRVEGRGRNDHFAVCAYRLDGTLAFNLDACRAAIGDHDLARKAVHERNIAALQSRPQIRVCRGPAATVMDRLLHQAEALLLRAIIVICQFKPGLCARLNEGMKQGVLHWTTLHMQRPIRTAPALLTAMAMFHALEVRQYIRIGPALRTPFFPAVEVFRVTTDIDKSVDGG